MWNLITDSTCHSCSSSQWLQ